MAAPRTITAPGLDQPVPKANASLETLDSVSSDLEVNLDLAVELEVVEANRTEIRSVKSA